MADLANDSARCLLAVYGNFSGHFMNALRSFPALLRTDPSVRITCITHNAVLKQFQDAVASATLPGEDFGDRWKSLLCGDAIKEPQDMMGHYKEIVEELCEHRWSEFFDGSAGRPIPNALVTDYFLPQIITKAKQVNHRATRFCHQPSIPGAIFQNMLRVRGQDEVLRVKGHAPIFAYEIVPASVPWPQSLPDQIEGDSNAPFWAGECNVVFTFSRDLIPDTRGSWDELLVKSGNRAVDIMASYAPQFWAEEDVTTGSDEVTAFLNANLKKHGKDSVIWVTFGTVHFPGAMRPDLIDAVFDALIAAKKPFVFVATAVTIMMMTDQGAAMKEKIIASGNIVTGWVDQPRFLKHPAVGLVFFHGGINTSFEALASGHPACVYAVCADQASDANSLVFSLDTAWELLQVKDQLVGKKLHQHPHVDVKGTPEAVRAEMEGVLKELDGPVGQRKRANAQKCARILRAEVKKQPEYLKEWVAMWA